MPATNVAIVPLHHHPTFSDSFYIDMIEFEQFITGSSVWLEDQSLNVFHDLRSGSYGYTSNQNDNTERFKLHVYSGNTSVDQVKNAGDIDIRKVGDDLLITFASAEVENQELIIYDLVGQELHRCQITTGLDQHVIQVPSLLQDNIYLVTIQELGFTQRIKW